MGVQSIPRQRSVRLSFLTARGILARSQFPYGHDPVCLSRIRARPVRRDEGRNELCCDLSEIRTRSCSRVTGHPELRTDPKGLRAAKAREMPHRLELRAGGRVVGY